MCEIKTVIIVAVLILAAADFYTYQVNLETKVGQHSEISVKVLAKKSTKVLFERRLMLLSI